MLVCSIMRMEEGGGSRVRQTQIAGIVAPTAIKRYFKVLSGFLPYVRKPKNDSVKPVPIPDKMLSFSYGHNS